MKAIFAAAAIALLICAGCQTPPREEPPAVDFVPDPVFDETWTEPAEPKEPVITDEETGRVIKVIGQAPEKFVADLVAGTLDADAQRAKAEAMAARMPANLDSERIGVFDFKETPMVDVLKVFTTLTGQNVVAGKNVMDLSITLFLKDVTPRVALSTMCKLYNLWYTQDENVIRLVTAEEYGKELVIRRDEKTLVFNLKYASALGVADIIAKLMGECIVYEQPEEFASYGHVGTEEDDSFGGRGGASSYRSRSTYASGSASSRSLVGRGAAQKGFEKDLTASQIEAFEAAATAARETGVSEQDIRALRRETAVGFMAVFPRNNSLAIRSVDSHLLSQVKDLVEVFDTVTRQVLLEVKVLRVTLDDGFDSLFDFTFAGDHAGAANTKHTGFSFNNPAAVIGSPTFEYTFLDKHIQTRLQLLQTEGRVNVVATPMLLCANNAPAEFFTGSKRPIVINHEYEIRDVATAGGAAATRETTRPVTQMTEIGQKMTITPSINEDGTITLRVLVDMSRAGIPAAVELVDSTGTLQTLAIDTVASDTVESIIVAKDGHTLALGGLIQEEIRDEVSKVPLLGDIPLIRPLFRRTHKLNQKVETVILIRPHIMLTPATADIISSEVVGGLSDHPFTKLGREHLLRYDRKSNKLSPEKVE